MRGVSTQPNSSCNLAASHGPPSSPYTMGRMAPEGTCHSVGACRSSVRCRLPGSRPRRASRSCEGSSAARELARDCFCPCADSNARSSAGASQSSRSASRAASDTSGHVSPSSSRIRLTRARHWRAASSHGRQSSPLLCTYSHRAAAHCPGRGRGRGVSSRISAPSTR